MRSIVIGGEGFIGSHLVNALRERGDSTVIFDIKSGDDARLTPFLIEALDGVDTIYHLAAHADIAQSATDPMIDFDNGTVITASVLEAARIAGVRRIMYASSSAVYGDVGSTLTDENFGPLIPTSTYAASKIACEAMLAAYASIFGIRSVAFRFANVVGPRQPRGIAFDFMKRLRADPTHLTVMGDGTQSKSYVHVADVVNGILAATESDESAYSVYNIATGDYLTAMDIAHIASEVLSISPKIDCAGGRNGWPGDVPTCRIDENKLRSIGWFNRYDSHAAIVATLEAML